MIRLFALLILLWPGAAIADRVRLAVTTSFHNSGLSDILLPALARDTGIDVQLLVVGTGQALRLGRSGDVDAILVHSKAAEEAFVAEGYGTHRREIMYNDFVIVGPERDPAQVGMATRATEALTQVARTQSPFVSRGDDSGTHRKERALWMGAGLDPDTFGTWYADVGAGMGASLNTATGLDAYILSDRASWLNFANKGELSLLFSGDPDLFNQYSFLPVNAVRHPHVNASGVTAVEAWLTSETAKALIDGYSLNGQQLFVFNATSAK
ncbi:MAG: substrate-binding domain-containing protein [Pseudomonadota bacterium]